MKTGVMQIPGFLFNNKTSSRAISSQKTDFIFICSVLVIDK
jgi:hypothetical protein